jgi:type VI secretion system secreted protein VgrG
VDETIHYYFEHTDRGHTMVVTTPGRSIPSTGETVIYTSRRADASSLNIVDGWEVAQELRSGQYVLWDHSFELPRNHLQAQKSLAGAVGGDTVLVGKVPHILSVGDNGKLEIYDYPGEYAKRHDRFDKSGTEHIAELGKIFEDGDRTTTIRMQQEGVSALAIHGTGTAASLVPGYQFTLDTYPDDVRARCMGAEGSYLVTGVTHFCRQAAPTSGCDGPSWHYRNQFECIPVAVPFRPPRVTPKPFVQGTQTATGVGSTATDEIYTDRYGRVKVKFHWDRLANRDTEASCWVRVAQAWAGRRWGTSFWPRVGQEVIVAFEEGDPDQPIIIGSVYNDYQLPPYLFDGLDAKHKNDNKVSGIKTCTTPGGNGFNELRFDDTKGKEQVFLRSQGALDMHVNGDHRTSVGGEEHLTIASNMREQIGGERTCKVGGEIRTEVDGDGFLGVVGSHVHRSAGWTEVTGLGGLYLKGTPGANLASDEIVVVKCGGSSITVTPDGIWINGPQVLINSGAGPALLVPQKTATPPVVPAAADDSKSGFPSNK